MIDILELAFVLALLSGLVFTLLGLMMEMRRSSVMDNRKLIVNAIGLYQKHCRLNYLPIEVDFIDMEDFDDTFKRFYDWGYTRILPKKKYELVKSFIDWHGGLYL